MFYQSEKPILISRIERFHTHLKSLLFDAKNVRMLKAEIAPTGAKHLSLEQAQTLSYQDAGEGFQWGKLWDSAWLRIHGEIPEEWQGQCVMLELNVGGEALLFDAAGCPECSFTNTSVFDEHYQRKFYRLGEKAQTGAFDRILELAANGNLGAETNPDCPGAACDVGTLRTLRYGVFRRDIWQLRIRFGVVMGLLNLQPCGVNCVTEGRQAAFVAGSFHERRVLHALNRAIDVFSDTPANAAAAMAELDTILQVKAPSDSLQVAAIGHAHIDTAWLWPMRETRRKVARTFANQIAMLEHYPDYVFGASQPQHYQFVKEMYPELYAKVKQKVQAGRWEPQGGMWVESDINMPCGESLSRQFLHGKNFFKDEFGVEVKNLWLPDVFGYSAALPQIVRQAGCDVFLTQKLCWNMYNKFPYHAFLWHGLDDTPLLTFFPPEDNYNTMLSPEQLNYGAANLLESDELGEFISLFGIGDGGGGPKEEVLERARLCADLNGCPKVKMSRSDAFFERLKTHTARLPEYRGELYFEMHRGTLTSQAALKRANRKNEQLLLATETLAALDTPENYPRQELEKAWKQLLTNQFHDILPGSSIGEVYRVALAEEAEIAATCATLLQQAGQRLLQVDANALTLINTLSSEVTQNVQLPESWQGIQEDFPCAIRNGRTWVRVSVKALSALTLHRDHCPKCAKGSDVQSETPVLENDLIRYEFNSQGQIIRAYDKVLAREMLDAPGNVLRNYADQPLGYDAWNVERFYENEVVEELAPQTISQVSSDALGSFLTMHYEFGNHSTLDQTVELAADSRELRFVNHGDCHERHRMLRVEFPVAVRNTQASFDIQYGFIQRDTTINDAYDLAKFEVPAHFFADLSNDCCGAALLNDCKYAYKVRKNRLDLALWRTPTWPDEEADQGEHRFTYAFLPHPGKLIHSEVANRAAALNRPLLQFDQLSQADAPQLPFPVKALPGTVRIEAIKRAEKSNDWIVRICEHSGVHAVAMLQLAEAVDSVSLCDLLEWETNDALELPEDRVLSLDMKPFELKTLRLRQKAR